MGEPGPRAAPEIVSSEQEPLILVDESDREIGHLSKAECHDGDGVLHRAFSLFIFNSRGELLLQRRSAEKRLWPLYWSNSCCSHPRHGETMDVATHRRLVQELGLEAPLHHLFTFQYHAGFEDRGSERELCWVFAGRCDENPQPNDHEIADFRWITADSLDEEMREKPETFTPWFATEWPRVRAEYQRVLGLHIS